jgi:hypothetical protein
VILVVAGLFGLLSTMNATRLWSRLLLAISVVVALSACVPL